MRVALAVFVSLVVLGAPSASLAAKRPIAVGPPSRPVMVPTTPTRRFTITLSGYLNCPVVVGNPGARCTVTATLRAIRIGPYVNKQLAQSRLSIRAGQRAKLRLVLPPASLRLLRKYDPRCICHILMHGAHHLFADSVLFNITLRHH